MTAGNSKKQQKRKAKPRGRPFKKGQSGNKRGRPPLPEDVKQWLIDNKGRLTVLALENLEKWIESADNKAGPAAIRIWLSKVLPDAAIAIELTGANGGPMQFDLSKLTDEELDVLERIRTRLDTK